MCTRWTSAQSWFHSHSWLEGDFSWHFDLSTSPLGLWWILEGSGDGPRAYELRLNLTPQGAVVAFYELQMTSYNRQNALERGKADVSTFSTFGYRGVHSSISNGGCTFTLQHRFIIWWLKYIIFVRDLDQTEKVFCAGVPRDRCELFLSNLCSPFTSTMSILHRARCALHLALFA